MSRKVTDPAAPRDRYAARLRDGEAESQSLVEEIRRLSGLRTTAFLGAVAAYIVGDLAGRPAAGLAAAAVALGLFVFLVRRHRRAKARLRHANAVVAWSREGLARLDREWERLYSGPPQRRDLSSHPYAVDLDLFGSASLSALLGRVHTRGGREVLETVLLEPSDPEEVAGRQAAVRELAADWPQREAAGVTGLLFAEHTQGETGGRFDDFQRWCQEDETVPPGLHSLAWLLPVVSLGTMVGDFALGWPAAPWVMGVLFQVVLAHRWGGKVHGDFAVASAGIPGLRRAHTLLEIWEEYPASSELLKREVEVLGYGADTSSRALARLERLLHLADLRLSSLYPVFAILLLWDIHVARRLFEWRRRHGSRVMSWFESLGRLEAMTSLATLAGDHPDWCWPVMATSGGEPVFRATGLGHPLLPGATRVANDVTLGPPGSVLLVTGSNMSGKSTLLRSVGLSVVMTRAGLPVCAETLELPLVRLFTSMRVQDSLEAGVSFFMAELLRLKALLDAAPARDAQSEPPLLYLVDEILQGTNSEERQTAGRRLIRHLLGRRALGAVTTHDLAFHRDERLEPHAVLVHFRESLDDEGDGLSFDYTLRPGLATTRNALRLAERVGLTEPEEG